MIDEPTPAPAAISKEGGPPSLVVIVNNSVEPPTVTPVGRLEKSTAAQLQDVVRQVLVNGPVDIVLSDLTHMDADGLRALATLRWRDSNTAEVHFKRFTTTVELSGEDPDEPVVRVEVEGDGGGVDRAGQRAEFSA